MIGIVDYRAGNLTSVARALAHLHEPCEVTDRPEVLDRASHIIFPGVGAAAEAMANLRRSGLDAWLKKWVQEGRPVLGICLGTQVILSESEEDGTTPGLGIIPAVYALSYQASLPAGGGRRPVAVLVHPSGAGALETV